VVSKTPLLHAMCVLTEAITVYELFDNIQHDLALGVSTYGRWPKWTSFVIKSPDGRHRVRSSLSSGSWVLKKRAISQ